MLAALLVVLAAAAVVFAAVKIKQSKSQPGAGQSTVPERKVNRTSERVGGASRSVKTASGRRESENPRLQAIFDQGTSALNEMKALRAEIKSSEITDKIDRISDITNRIMDDAEQDQNDIYQIRKFFTYYLPTTVKLLESYKKLESQDIQGENITKGMSDISSMLDTALEAYEKRLDSLFENQTMDIETEIDVFNQMLQREGFAEAGASVIRNSEFVIRNEGEEASEANTNPAAEPATVPNVEPANEAAAEPQVAVATGSGITLQL